jgi:ribonuclease E
MVALGKDIMSKKMLIDATHPEETRVVVADGNRVEEFDFESLNKRQLAGNIYLAKVTRVEPSLQAAFVDYGGNRHGFLAFSEIHPDYYQIPLADREALLAEENALIADEDDDQAKSAPRSNRRRRKYDTKPAQTAKDPVINAEIDDGAQDGQMAAGMDIVDPKSTPFAGPDAFDTAESESGVPAAQDESVFGADLVDENAGLMGDDTQSDIASAQDDLADQETPTNQGASDDTQDDAADAVDMDDAAETVADDDTQDDIRPVRKPRPRRYKIQEVIKVRQIMLIQVVKEERGNKGAALTTYLSLAGRYCVLMPNTARGGGISRKIINASDRKKLKDIATSFDVPQGAGLIIRTAGANRTKTEIKRDYEYLQRQWEQTRELTLKSTAPAPIYEEGNLIHRSIRDLYNREIDEVLVEGRAGYRQAKDFMKMLMPSHAAKVKHYSAPMPLFVKHKVEGYLADMFNPVVQLKSGGYIVIGITEALVAIDVNSGRATQQGSIEETALKTNLEAADEVARQLRLRDLAGLIVIDFIDMDDRRNNIAVEKRIKERLKTDRARIQVGRISSFGLMEMSRQRLRPGMVEATTQACQHCHGTGLIRSDDNIALSILRQFEEEGAKRGARELRLTAPVGVVNFILNEKRDYLADIQTRYGIYIRVEADANMAVPDYKIEKLKTTTRPVPATAVVSSGTVTMDDFDEEDQDQPNAAPPQDTPIDDTAEDQPKKKRRRRRGGRGRKKTDASGDAGVLAQQDDDAAAAGSDGGGADDGPQAGVETPSKADRANGQSRGNDNPSPQTNSTPQDAHVTSQPAPVSDGVGDSGEPASKDAPKDQAPAKSKRRGWWSFGA